MAGVPLGLADGSATLDRYDRAFRIRYNSGQTRADRWAVAGGSCGCVLGGIAAPVGALVGGMLGIAVGTVGAGVYTNTVVK